MSISSIGKPIIVETEEEMDVAMQYLENLREFEEQVEGKTK